ncbi:MAG: dTDP-glucose 4,6-dehydratase [Alphaproteobacteria bacterium]
MRPILVTGGAGFIGSNYVQAALHEGRSVVVLDLLTYAGNRANLAAVEGRPNLVFVEGSIGDRTLLDRLFAQHRPDAVVDFAAESHVDRSIDGPAAFVETNVVGAFTLLEAARSYWDGLNGAARDGFRFLHVSTDEVYGSLEDGAATEATAYAPNSPYAATKAAADHLVRAFHMTYGLPTLVTNCTNNYGPYQFPEKLIPLMIINALQGKALPVYGDGAQVRDWIHVADHCRGIDRVLEAGKPGHTYNIGAEDRRTNRSVIEGICAVLDTLRPRTDGASHASLMTTVADRPGHDRRYALDTARIRAELGWAPAVAFDAGLRSTIEWYMSHQAWWEDLRRRTRYQGQRLGLAVQQG